MLVIETRILTVNSRVIVKVICYNKNAHNGIIETYSD